MLLIDERHLFGLLVMIQISGLLTLLAARCGSVVNRPVWNFLFLSLLIFIGGWTAWGNHD